jgi:polyphenol oxidase
MPDSSTEDWIIPDWPAPSWVRALSTTRRGGTSLGPYTALNLADHVGDDAAVVAANRRRPRDSLTLPAEPAWLKQVHGCGIVDLDAETPGNEGDGAVAGSTGRICAVLTADCLPVLLCDRAGTRVGAVHAGWRGLAAGVLEAAVTRLNLPGSSLIAWLGPAIGPRAFEVGEEVRAAFVAGDPLAAGAFEPHGDRWHADIYRLAHQRLAALGVTEIHGGEWCTYDDAERFYSYRRDGVTGRLATLIWLEDRKDSSSVAQ